MTVTPAPLDALPGLGLIIGDRRITDVSGGHHEHIYAATGRKTVDVPLAGASEIDLAVRAARRALPGWRSTTLAYRRDLMLRVAQLITERADELARTITLDNATPEFIAGFMPPDTANMFSYNAGWVDKIGGQVVPNLLDAPGLNYTLEEPYGVVAVLIPFNGPLNALGMTLGPILAAGNTVVIKPPETTPFVALRFGELLLDAGIPPGVVNVVPGGAEAGEALCGHPGVDKIHFTGSGATARHVLTAANRNLTPVHLELGGKSAKIIFADADLDLIAADAVNGAVNLSGQGCINGTRVLVQRSVYEQVVDSMAEIAAMVSIGDPLEAGNMMGPVISDGACRRILGVIDRAVDAKDGRLVVGGERLGGDLADGYFISPAIFADVDNTCSLAQNEVFGPVITVTPFEDEAEAIALANGTDFGLAAYLHTNDVRRVHNMAAALEAGNVWVNGFFNINLGGPFGGMKKSGYGRLGGIEGVREFSRVKSIWMAL